MHVVPIRASSPQLIEHRLTGHQAPNLYMNDYTFNGASSPQLMIMHGLSNQCNNNQQLQRLRQQLTT